MILVIMKEGHFIRMCPMLLIFFDLGIKSGMERPQNIKIGFENNNVNEQTRCASTFDIMNVTECYCKIGNEFYPEDKMNFDYGTNNYNEPFKEIVKYNEDYNGLPQYIKLHISQRTFKCSQRIYVFDTGYQYDHIVPQPIQLNLEFSVAIADVICNVLVITRKGISVKTVLQLPISLGFSLRLRWRLNSKGIIFLTSIFCIYKYV